MSLLKVTDLSVEVGTAEEPTKAVRGVSFSLEAGEVLAIVGESGSGKSMLCKSIMHLLPKSGRITAGHVFLDEKEITFSSDKEMCSLRGSEFSMIFQDPMTSLDPTYTVGKQIAEAIRLHDKSIAKEKLDNRVIELMEMVGIEDAKHRKDLYPYNLSGGMRQRCVLAIAIASNPKILIADEPTTALDVTIQAQILSLLKDIQKALNTSTIFVSHDLAVVAQVADRVAIMQNGVFVETGTIEEVFTNPKHEYTRHLLKDRPSVNLVSQKQNSSENKETLLEIRNLHHHFPLTKKTKIHAVHDVSLEMKKGEILGIVGESGSGKSTLARCIMNIYPSYSGELIFEGIHTEDKKEYRKNRKFLQAERQMIFQDSYSSLNPRMKVWDIITEPLRIHHKKTPRGSYRAEAAFQLKYVGMDEKFLDKYPSEMSGGERQRVAIARALTMEPALLIADEPVASLDVTTQSQIIHLFEHLRDEHGFSILFVAHDLMLVRSICDRVAVMKHGEIVEIAPTEQLFETPQHPYTKELLAAIPDIEGLFVNEPKK